MNPWYWWGRLFLWLVHIHWDAVDGVWVQSNGRGGEEIFPEIVVGLGLCFFTLLPLLGAFIVVMVLYGPS